MTHFEHLEYGKKDRLLLLRLGCKETSYAASLASLLTLMEGSCRLVSFPLWCSTDREGDPSEQTVTNYDDLVQNPEGNSKRDFPQSRD